MNLHFAQSEFRTCIFNSDAKLSPIVTEKKIGKKLKLVNEFFSTNNTIEMEKIGQGMEDTFVKHIVSLW